MSTMPATGGHSEACCNVPPVVTKGYEAKGKYEEIGGFKTYVTGPADATKAILFFFDIFGYFEQTLQGADILATAGNQKYKVFMPDWFDGKPVPIEWYPPKTDEQKKALGDFFGKNSPPRVAGLVPDYVKAAEKANPSIKEWGIIGFCWGGKVVTLVVSSPSNVFKAAAKAHPAMVDPADAKGIKIPFALLASGDEDKEAVKGFEANLALSGSPRHVETFADQIHGWMAARANLADERVAAEYRRGYQTVLDFFGKHWQ